MSYKETLCTPRKDKITRDTGTDTTICGLYFLKFSVCRIFGLTINREYLFKYVHIQKR